MEVLAGFVGNSQAECVWGGLYVQPLWETAEIVLAAHTVDSARTGFNKEAAAIAWSAPCMHAWAVKEG